MSEMTLASNNITRKPGVFEKRIHEIDFARGILILLVLMDHMFWCLQFYNGQWMTSAKAAGHSYQFYKFIYDIAYFYWTWDLRDGVRFFALFGFCFISGISSAFSRNNWVRAGQMLAVYGLITVGSNALDATGYLTQGARIDFNVIGVLAWSTLFYCFFQKRSWKALLAGALIWFLMASYVIPWLHKTPIGSAYAPPLWNPEEIDIDQADWMPLFPFMFFFFLGAVVSYFVYAPTKKSLIPHRGQWERPFCFVGRNTLWIYLGHQFFFIPLFLLLGLFLGK